MSPFLRRLPVAFLWLWWPGLHPPAIILSAAPIELPAIYGDHMVFQRGQPVVIMGKGDAGQRVRVRLSPGSSSSSFVGNDGNWKVTLPPQPASDIGQPLSLEISVRDHEIMIHPVHIGDVWLCAGQSNMNFLMRPNPPWSEGVPDWESETAAARAAGLSLFTVVPEAACREQSGVTGVWRPAQPSFVEFFPAVPYYFGYALRRDKGIPIGILVAALGATSIRHWMDESSLREIADAERFFHLQEQRDLEHAEVIRHYAEETVFRYRKTAVARMLEPNFPPRYPAPYPQWRYQPAGLFNAMLAPLDSFPIRGFAWYQGESDATRHSDYWDYLKRLVRSWRERRGDKTLPFLLVQLPNFDPVALGRDPAQHGDTWALMREAQERVLELPSTGLVVTADIGDPLKIHPRDKKNVAERLALAARAVAHGEKGIVYSGPRLAGAKIEGRTVHLAFFHTGTELILDKTRASGTGKSFELAGADGIFHAATASIAGGNIVVESDQVERPVEVRYAFDNNPRLILYNAEGLPAAPFRVSLP